MRYKTSEEGLDKLLYVGEALAFINYVLLIYGQRGQQSMDQPGKAANPARGLLSREKFIFPVPARPLRIWSCETGSAVPSRVSLLISILRPNLVLTYGIPPAFRDGVQLFIPLGQFRVYRVTQ